MRGRAFYIAVGLVPLIGAVWAQSAKKAGIQLNPTPPFDVIANPNETVDGQQVDFDVFSWNSFIALNWPAKPDGSPDLGRKPGAAGDNDTVWEHWIDSPSITVPPGQTPIFNAPQNVPAACSALAAPGRRVLQQVGKTPGLLTDTNQPFDTGPLVDQSKAYARFEIRLNRDMFDYILTNRLYSKAGQQAFAGVVKFPCGQTGKQVGAMVVKAAWKILGAADDASHFHTINALVYTPSANTCSLQKVGLAGLHIAHKTNHSPQWIWSTFEQRENAPTDAEVKAGKLQAKYNFYDPKCANCAVNTAAPRPWNPAAHDSPATQVVRLVVIPAAAQGSAAARNKTAQALLASVNSKSVWKYYELISTQWPADPGNTTTCTANPADPGGNPAPVFLANSTMETFVQGKSENVSSSCILCHNNAAMAAGGSRGASDFTYILQHAQ